jgi:hypothetical protein
MRGQWLNFLEHIILDSKGKKKVGPVGYAIIIFFGSINMYKFSDETHQRFMEDLVLFIYKGYKILSTCQQVWLHRLILCMCPQVVFPSQSSLVEKVCPTMVAKSMELHDLTYLESTNPIIFVN